MGKLVVHLPNRPSDEEIDCGEYGRRLNMKVHDVESIDGVLVLGMPLQPSVIVPDFVQKEKKQEQPPNMKPQASKDEEKGGEK